jgi:hypothetical protein
MLQRLKFMECGQLYSKALHNLYFSPNCIRVITSRRIRWTGHVTPVRDNKYEQKFLLGKHKGKKTLKTQV